MVFIATPVWLVNVVVALYCLDRRNKCTNLNDWQRWNKYQAITHLTSLCSGVWFGVTLAQYIRSL